MDEKKRQAMIEKILCGKKYRELDIPHATVADLFEQELKKGLKKNKTVKAVKAKLHNIIAPYLDTLDYAETGMTIDRINPQDDATELVDLCRDILSAHDSTRERLSYHQDFFAYLFSCIGPHCKILDLACGLNPVFLPLVPLPEEMEYIAYDIHGPRINLLNHIFQKASLNARAVNQDILIKAPSEKACAAFLFKEAHRIEKRESGGSRRLIQSVQAHTIFISLPTHNLHGRFNLQERMERLVDTTIHGIADLIETKEFASEMVYMVRKRDG
jgi:16S rRNA (guanine(1405)-N(7))-methyltransferase